MDLHCPYCHHTMSVKGVRAGRFTPRCTNCQEKFLLAIPEGENAVPVVKKMPKAADGAVTQTVAPTFLAPSASVAGATVPPQASAQATSTVPPAPAAKRASMETVAPAQTIPPSRTVAPTQTLPPDRPPRAAAQTAMPASLAPTPRVATPHPPAEPPTPNTKVRHAINHTADDSFESLGGYQILRKLGQGGMGAVYLAKQVSLDRLVAVKVLSPELAEDAGFVARFTREAYAAAQLVHHNIVQVHDIGEDRGRHFYSMEFVEGETLASLVHRNGKLDPETAVAYILQAARGLKFAHERGLIHRDVKPDNLMLNNQGIIKVADLGLVKKHGVDDPKHAVRADKLEQVQSADTTGFNSSMGTPAYMAPEQARDAAHVDHRADIYSLGCTLYDLLTGRPPFTGKTAVEVMTKHANEPITPPDVLSKRVPKEVSALLMKMVAKRPEDRYVNTAACIVAMEDFLGTSSTGPFTPKEEHAAAIEANVKAFREKPLALVARYAVPAFFALIAFVAAMAAMFSENVADKFVAVGTYAGLAVLTVVAYIIVAGITRRDVVLGRLRPLFFDAAISDWLRGILVAGVLVMLLWVFGLVWAWAVVALIAFACAAAYHFGLQMPRDKQRKTAVDSVEEMLRSMRLKGLEEDTLRQFVCRYSGKHWEEFYEALFGYDAKMEARRRWGLSLRGKARPKFGVWRDAIIAWANARVVGRKQAREKKLLAKVEEKRLKAEGVDLLQARRAAQKEAAAIIQQSRLEARRIVSQREADARQAATVAPTHAAATVAPTPAPAPVPAAVHLPHRPAVLDEPVERDHESSFARKGGFKALLFGTTIRFPAALVLLAAFFLWFHQNNPQFPNNFGQTIKEAGDATITGLQKGKLTIGDTVKDSTSATPAARRGPPDLRLAILPEPVRHQLSGYGVGLAGLLLLVSCLFSGWLLGLLALVGAAVMVGGSLFIPSPIAGLDPKTIAAVAGTFVFVVGFLIGRER